MVRQELLGRRRPHNSDGQDSTSLSKKRTDVNAQANSKDKALIKQPWFVAVIAVVLVAVVVGVFALTKNKDSAGGAADFPGANGDEKVAVIGESIESDGVTFTASAPHQPNNEEGAACFTFTAQAGDKEFETNRSRFHLYGEDGFTSGPYASPEYPTMEIMTVPAGQEGSSEVCFLTSHVDQNEPYTLVYRPTRGSGKAPLAWTDK